MAVAGSESDASSAATPTGRGGTATAGRRSRSLSLAERRVRTAWLYLLPMLAVLALVALWPLLRTIGFSFTDAFLSDLGAWEFIGFANYVALLQDSLWWRAVGNTLLFAAISVSLELTLGLIIALTLDAHLPGRGLVRAAVLIPWAIPTVVSAKMWGWMLNDLYGVVNAVFITLGLINQPWAWLADPFLSMGAVIAVDVWKATPFMALLSLAALQVLPKEIYESARMDGASTLRTFFSITLPLIRPALVVAVVFRGLDALRVFDVIYVLTGNNANTATMSVYARQQLVEFQDVGYGSAAATCLFLIVALITVLVLMAGRIDLGGTGEKR